jgi:hypothetical protein
MLAEAIAPYRGIVIWRAFVYAADPKGDRFKEAYKDFKPLDGTFASNVLVQVKNDQLIFNLVSRFIRFLVLCPKRRWLWNSSLHKNIWVLVLTLCTKRLFSKNVSKVILIQMGKAQPSLK